MKILRSEVIESTNLPVDGLFGVVNKLIFTYFNITDAELQYINDNATKEEIQILTGGLGGFEQEATFTEKRQALQVRDKYLQQFKQSI